MIDPFGNQLREDIAKALWQVDHDNYRNGAQHWPDYESIPRMNMSLQVNGVWMTFRDHYEAAAHVAMQVIDAKERGK